MIKAGKKMIFAFFLCALAALVNTAAPAEEMTDPEEMLVEARKFAQIAIAMTNNAFTILKDPKSRDDIQSAMQLLAQAGRNFENAENLFQTLGEQYGSTQDIGNCRRGKEECVQAINYCRQTLSRTQ